MQPEPWSSLTTRVLASNPGPMTLDGTNSLIIREADSSRVVVVDPGPREESHLARLMSYGPVDLILLTHHHVDHTESARRLHELTNAPVRAIDPALTIAGSPLADGEVISAAGCRIEVLASPGHSADSACFFLAGDRPLDDSVGRGSMITGDTILGRGTTVIAEPDGSLEAYLRSLSRLKQLGPILVLPGHGPALPDLEAVAARYLEHRWKRLQDIADLLADECLQPSTRSDTVSLVVEALYGGLPEAVRSAAETSVRQQLRYLENGGPAAKKLLTKSASTGWRPWNMVV